MAVKQPACSRASAKKIVVIFLRAGSALVASHSCIRPIFSPLVRFIFKLASTREIEDGVGG